MRYLFLLLLMPLVAKAQTVEDQLPAVTNCLAITNARVITKAGQPEVKHTIIIRDGLITHVGPDVTIPADAFVVKADSLFVYPAFIDALSYIGIPEPEQENRRSGNTERPPIDEEGHASSEATGFTPGTSIRSTFKVSDKSITEWRNAGFAISHVVPRGRTLPGSGSLVVLSGKRPDNMIWKENISMFGQFSGAGSGLYPNTIIAVMSKWRENYRNSEQWITHEKMYNSLLATTRPEYLQVHKDLAPLVEKKIPLFFRAPSVKDMSRAISLQKDLGMKMILAETKEADLLITDLQQTGIPVVLSSSLPEAKKKEVKKDETGGKTSEGGSKNEDKKEENPKTPEQIAFESKRDETLLRYQKQAATLANAKIPFSFSTINTKPADFHSNLRTMVGKGLSPDKALEALTMEPARILGIDTYCGSIEKGKMANLLISTKPLFEKDMNIQYMVVEGSLYKLDIKTKNKSQSKSDVQIEGNWTFVADHPDGPVNGNFIIKKENDNISGTITIVTLGDADVALDAIEIDGNTLSFSYKSQSIDNPIYFNLTIDGKSITGTGGNSDIGTYEIHGQNTSSPE